MPIPASTETLGWEASLSCSFEPGPNRTIVRRSHSGPLSMQRAFYPEGAVAHVYLLHPPAGVVGGDSLEIQVQCENDAAGLLTTPGATRFYRSDGQQATVQQTLKVCGGSLEWLPQENIFFTGCNVYVKTNIQLDDSASLAWWDINCYGREVGNEPFTEGQVKSVLELYRSHVLLLRERLVVDDRHPLQHSCGFRGNTVTGTLLLTPMHSESIESVRSTSW